MLEACPFCGSTVSVTVDEDGTETYEPLDVVPRSVAEALAEALEAFPFAVIPPALAEYRATRVP